MAESNQYRLAVRAAGSTDAWQILRRTDGGPGITTNMENPNEVDDSGQDVSMLLTSITVGGDVSIAFSAETYDLIIQNVMGGTFDATDGTLLLGNDTPQLEFFVGYMDLSKAYLIKEANVSQLQLSLSAGAILTGSFSIVGEDYDADYDFSADTFTEATTTKPFNCAQDVNEITIEGAGADGVCVNTLDITVNRNYQEDPCIGKLVANQYKGTASVSGSVSLALTAETFGLLGRSINEEEFGIRIDMNDGAAGNSYLFNLPRVKLAVEMPSAGRDGVLRPAINYTALKDATLGSSLQITRTLGTAAAAQLTTMSGDDYVTADGQTYGVA